MFLVYIIYFHLSELAGQTSQFVNGRFYPKVYPSSLNFFKITRAIFGVIIFKDFALPSIQKDAFDLQTGWPVLTSG